MRKTIKYCRKQQKNKEKRHFIKQIEKLKFFVKYILGEEKYLYKYFNIYNIFS